MLMSQRTIMVVISNLLYKLFAIPMVFEDACAQKVLDSSIKNESTCLYTKFIFTRIYMYIQCNIHLQTVQIKGNVTI